ELVEPADRVVGVGIPPLLGPDFDASAVPDHRNGGSRLDAGEPALLRAQADPALSVELASDRLREEGAGQCALFLAEEWILQSAGEALPLVRRVDRQDAVLADRDVAATFGELPPKGRRNCQTPLLVDPDPVGAPEHRDLPGSRWSFRGSSSRLPRYTAQDRS